MTSLCRAPLTRALPLAAIALSSVLAGCPGDPSAADAGRDALEPADVLLLLDAPPTEPDAFAPLDAPVEPDDDASATDAPSTEDAAVMGNAFIARSCGPADGPALQITISDFRDPSMCTADPLRPSTMFYVHDLGGASLPPTAGATITSTMASSNGSATQCPGGSPPCRLSEDWSITFATYEDRGGATGQYTITWIGGEVSTGTFVATRCEAGPVLCG